MSLAGQLPYRRDGVVSEPAEPYRQQINEPRVAALLMHRADRPRAVKVLDGLVLDEVGDLDEHRPAVHAHECRRRDVAGVGDPDCAVILNVELPRRRRQAGASADVRRNQFKIFLCRRSGQGAGGVPPVGPHCGKAECAPALGLEFDWLAVDRDGQVAHSARVVTAGARVGASWSLIDRRRCCRRRTANGAVGCLLGVAGPARGVVLAAAERWPAPRGRRPTGRR
jgi:hypothetical protein